MLLAILVMFSLYSPVRSEGYVYVESGGTSTTCASLDDACGSIQAALDVAAEGNTIVIGAGTFAENLRMMMAGVTMKGNSDDPLTTEIVSAGGVDGIEAPEGVAADVVLDILAADITHLHVMIPEGVPTKRDIDIFVRPPAANAKMDSIKVERKRIGDASNLEPTMPGSRGLLVFRATGTVY